jgi:hypothetical protein
LLLGNGGSVLLVLDRLFGLLKPSFDELQFVLLLLGLFLLGSQFGGGGGELAARLANLAGKVVFLLDQHGMQLLTPTFPLGLAFFGHALFLGLLLITPILLGPHLGVVVPGFEQGDNLGASIQHQKQED